MKNIFNRPLKQNVFLIDGDENYLKDLLIARLRNSLFENTENMTFNFDQFDGPDLLFSDLLQACQQFPLWVEKRLVVVKQADNIFSVYKSECMALLSQLPSTTLLIFQGKKFNKTLKIVKTIASFNGVHQTIKRLDRKDCEAFIKEELLRLNQKMESDAMQFILDHVEPEAGILHQEILKLTVFVGKEQSVKLADVQQVVNASREVDVFRLVDVIAAGDDAKALVLINKCLEEGQQALQLMGLIRWHFKILTRIKVLQNRNLSDQEISKTIAMPYYRVGSFFRQAAKYDLKKLIWFFDLFGKITLKLKISPVDDVHILSSMVLNMASKYNYSEFLI